MLNNNRQSLAVAESCTGGLISASITQRKGASSFFKGSVVVYHTKSKSDLLGVSEALVEEYTVVSKEVAEAMALSVKKKFNADYGIATTGIAGPEKGDSNLPLGTVFIAIATPNDVLVKEFNFGDNRYKVIERAKNKALQLLRLSISESK